MKVKYALSGLLIGILIGFIIGFGELGMIKKFQRTQIILVGVGLEVGIFGIVGYSIGNNLGRNIDIENELGISEKEERMHQQGTVWVAITRWTNKRDNILFELITGQTEQKILISQLNEKMIFNHQIASGSKNNVAKFHKLAMQEIFTQQKKDYKS